MPTQFHCETTPSASSDASESPQHISAHHQAADCRTFCLSLVAGRVYAVLCALLPLGIASTVSQTKIAQLARLSRRHVGRALDELVGAGLITRTTPPGHPQLVTLLPLDPTPMAPATPPAAPQLATVTTLLRAYLAAQPADAEIITTVRQLAQAIGRPHAGGISPALDRLANSGEILRFIRRGRTVIQVLHLADEGVDHADPPLPRPEDTTFCTTTTNSTDLPPDRDPPPTQVDQAACMENMFYQQQQQHGAGARESLPEELTATEWALLHQYDPTYDQARVNRRAILQKDRRQSYREHRRQSYKTDGLLAVIRYPTHSRSYLAVWRNYGWKENLPDGYPQPVVAFAGNHQSEPGSARHRPQLAHRPPLSLLG